MIFLFCNGGKTMRNSMLKRSLVHSVHSSFAGIVFRLCFCRKRAAKHKPFLCHGVLWRADRSVYRIPHRDHCGWHAEAVCTLAFSFEVENASFEAQLPIILKKAAGWQYAVRNRRGWFSVRKAEPQGLPFWPHSRKRFPIGM